MIIHLLTDTIGMSVGAWVRTHKERNTINSHQQCLSGHFYRLLFTLSRYGPVRLRHSYVECNSRESFRNVPGGLSQCIVFSPLTKECTSLDISSKFWTDPLCFWQNSRFWCFWHESSALRRDSFSVSECWSPY